MKFRVKLKEEFDADLLPHVEEVFQSESLLHAVMHGHLLLERALTTLIGQKMRRPNVLEDGAFGRWSFQQKLGLYVGLYDPPEQRQQMLLGFNRLRNALAHRLDDAGTWVSKCLPWDEESPPPSARVHVWSITATLFFDLGILQGIENLEAASPSTYRSENSEARDGKSREGVVTDDKSKGLDSMQPYSRIEANLDQPLELHFMHPRHSGTSLTADVSPKCSCREALSNLTIGDGAFLPMLPPGRTYELVIHRTQQRIEPEMSFEEAGAIDGDWIDIQQSGCLGL